MVPPKQPGAPGTFSLFGALFAFYPLAVFLGFRYLGAHATTVLLALIFLARGVADWRHAGLRRSLKFYALGAALALVAASGRAELVLFLPVLISVSLMAVFLFSLFTPVSVVERIALAMHPEIPPEGLAYCRSVTRAWCGFFLANSLAALWTIRSDSLELWTWYNGFLSYILVGLFFTGELLVRRRHLSRMKVS
ncbi:MAG: hypothetical protein IT290_00755 [Deltaproteobacteria bacterium]|nr:hypothetical protein [Deltaproteobacteria bacterium]